MTSHPSSCLDLLIDRILHKAKAYDAEIKDAKDKVDDIAAAVRISLHDVDSLTHPVHPVPAVDTACDDIKEDYHSAACSLLTGELIDLLIKLIYPIVRIDAACNKGQKDTYNDAPLFDAALAAGNT